MNDKEQSVESGGERQVYEIGFHIMPTVSEEDLPKEVSQIKEVLEEHQVMLVGEEEFPKKTELAYEVSVKIDNQKKYFNKAYFGWIKFEAEPSQIPEIERKFKELKNILRFILIKTVRSNKMVSQKNILKKEKTESKESDKKNESKKKDEEKDSDKDVDEAIDDLVID